MSDRCENCGCVLTILNASYPLSTDRMPNAEGVDICRHCWKNVPDSEKDKTARALRVLEAVGDVEGGLPRDQIAANIRAVSQNKGMPSGWILWLRCIAAALEEKAEAEVPPLTCPRCAAKFKSAMAYCTVCGFGKDEVHAPAPKQEPPAISARKFAINDPEAFGLDSRVEMLENDTEDLAARVGALENENDTSVQHLIARLKAVEARLDAHEHATFSPERLKALDEIAAATPYFSYELKQDALCFFCGEDMGRPHAPDCDWKAIQPPKKE